MVAHAAGPAGSPPPPSRNEVLLREAVDRLRGELDAARAFERFIREHATTSHIRALTLVESWDRLVASGDAYPGSEEALNGR